MIASCPLPAHWHAERLHERGALEATFEVPPRPLRLRGSLFVHLCSGPRRTSDVMDCIVKQAGLYNMNLWVIALDPCIAKPLDLINDDVFGWLRQAARSGLLVGCFGSPPCATFSRARHAPGGPRPLRKRSSPMSPLVHLSKAELRHVEVANVLAFRVCLLSHEVCHRGGVAMIEHPRDLGAPAPSLFHRGPIVELLSLIPGSKIMSFDQCMFGCEARKPTSVWAGNVDGRGLHGRFCEHTRGHPRAIGWSWTSRSWKTTPLAQYPDKLSDAIALFMIKSLAARLVDHRLPMSSHGEPIQSPSFESAALPFVLSEGSDSRGLRWGLGHIPN